MKDEVKDTVKKEGAQDLIKPEAEKIYITDDSAVKILKEQVESVK